MASKKLYSSMGKVPGRFREEILVCQFTHMTNSQGRTWFRGEIFDYSLPVLLAQLSLIFIVTRSTYYLVKPLKQSMISAQLIAGIIMGRSFLGRNKSYTERLFPPGGRLILETFADIGFMFHLFILGVRTDALMVKKVRKNVALIGISGYMLPYALGGLAMFMLPYVILVDESVGRSLPSVIVVNSMSSFPVITGLLQDLKILNSEVGRIATWASMFSDFCSYFLTMLMSTIDLAIRKSHWSTLYSIAGTAMFLMLVVFIIRPFMIRMSKSIPDGEAMHKAQFLSIMVVVLSCGLCTEALGQPAALGTFILGMAVPDGPPIGSALVHKLETLSTGLLLPAKFAISGLNMDIFSVHSGTSGVILELVILLGYVGKFTGILIPAVYFKVPFMEAITLALIMCCKGIIEAAVYIMLMEDGMLSDEAYTLLLVSMLIVTGIARPLIWFLYDPSARYIGYRTSSIMFSDPHDELRVLVCIHKTDNVPTMINLLEASNPTKKRPMGVLALNLLELKGRAAAMLVPGAPGVKLKHVGSRADQVGKAFKNFAQRKKGSVLLEHFISVSPYKSMHDDICTLALDKRANIVIIPFHKQWEIDGSIGDSFPSVRLVNRYVMAKAPCSVGVLIDRGQIANNQSMLTGSSMFRAVMLFMGGADDCEALAYSSRMAEHPHISFTLVRLRSKDDEGEHDHDDMDKTFDTEMIDRFRAYNMGNDRFKYREEAVKDAVGTTMVLRSLEQKFDLCIVGRYHDPRSSVTLGLTEWSECPELGVVGDMLATSDFRFSVLVVQHQAPGPANMDSSTLLSVPSSISSRMMDRDTWNSDMGFSSFRSGTSSLSSMSTFR